MMIIDPVALGDVACTRASPGTYFDRNGVLQTAPANTLRVTYDPSDLTKAPYAMVEAATANLIPGPGSLNGGRWFGTAAATAFDEAKYPDPMGGTRASRWTVGGTTGKFMRMTGTSGDPGPMVQGQQYSISLYLRPVSGNGVLRLGMETPSQQVYLDLSTMTVTAQFNGAAATLKPCGGGWYRLACTFTGDTSGNRTIIAYVAGNTTVFDVFGDQLEAGPLTSYTEGARAADVIASGAGLAYSNVPITEQPYNSTATYAKDIVVYDPATFLTYQSLVANNTGKALADPASWTPLLVPVNRKKMFDQYNYTQTQSAEEIIVVLSPQAISRGVFLGNVDASEVRISVTDLTAGLVYQEVQSLIVSNSGSSAYAWCFNPIDKSDYAVSVLLPPYANSLITIAIKAPGSTVKCGVCVIGPVVDVGLSQYGLSWELQDYSTINFNMDGTSNVVPRNYAKKLSADVIIDNSRIAAVTRNLSRLHQKPVAWVGASMYGPACAYGRYESFKGVINYPTQSQMTLSILGTV